MGWTSNDGGRENVTKRQRQPWTTVSGNTVTVLKHHRHKDQDWFLCEVRDPAGNFVSKSIQLTVWEGGAHKEMSAAMHPYYYGCPVSWLDEVPEENATWRAAVRSLAGKVAA